MQLCCDMIEKYVDNIEETKVERFERLISVLIEKSL